MRRVPREWSQFTYLDPEVVLAGLREISCSIPLHEFEYHVRTLRSRKLRKYGEGRQAALFCYGMSRRLGVKVQFAHVERQDYDFIAAYEMNGDVNFVPVQLKEWVPENLPSPRPLQFELDKLGKYTDSSDLVVVFHLNRQAHVTLSELSFPRNIGGLWFLGCTDPNQNRWTLIGDLLTDPGLASDFAYPTTNLSFNPDAPKRAG